MSFVPDPDQAAGGALRALSTLFQAHPPRSTRRVELRLDPNGRRRLDAADVAQDAFLEVTRRFAGWAMHRRAPVHVWLRSTTTRTLVQARRRHLGAHARAVLRETPAVIRRPSVSGTNSADAFVASATSVSPLAGREGWRARVTQALENLGELDREIVAPRRFEGASNEDTALLLAVSPANASKRVFRALLRWRPALQPLAPGEASGAS